MKTILIYFSVFASFLCCIYSNAQAANEKGFMHFSGNSYVINSDNQSIVLGCSVKIAGDTSDIYLIKLDAQLDTVWAKKFDFGFIDKISCIRQTNDNGFIVSLNADYKLIIFKTDGTGNIQWARNYATGDSPKLLVLNDGYILASNVLELTPGYGTEIRFAKLDSTGNILWDKALVKMADQSMIDIMPGAHKGFTIFAAEGNVTTQMRIDSNYNYYNSNYVSNLNFSFYKVMAYYNDSTIIAGVNNGYIQRMMKGQIQWSRKLYMLNANNDTIKIIPRAICKTADGNFVLAGEITTTQGWMDRDMLVVKMDTNANFIWSRKIGRTNVSDEVLNILERPDQNLVLTFSSFYSGAADYQFNTMLLDASGNGNCDNVAVSASVTASEYYNSPGIFYTQAALNSSSSIKTYNDLTVNLVLTSPCYPAGMDAGISGIPLFVSPNPVTDILHIAGTNQQGAVYIFDMTGRLVKTNACTDHLTQVSVSDLPDAMYVLKYITPDHTAEVKFIKK